MRFAARLEHQWYNDILHWAVQSKRFNLSCGDSAHDFLLVDSAWWKNNKRRNGFVYVKELARFLTRDWKIPVIAIDHCDVFLPKFLPEDLQYFALVLKGHGLPVDRDLMNWQVGPRYGLNRKDKLNKVPAELQLSPNDIAKHRVSFDMGMHRHLVDKLQGKVVSPSLRQNWHRYYDCTFIGSFNSLNRLRCASLIRKKYTGVARLVELQKDHPIGGLSPRRLHKSREKVISRHRELFGVPIQPPEYARIAESSKVLPAFSGVGELGPRHYQAFSFSRILVCEDLSHIETVYPFEAGRNYFATDDEAKDFERIMDGILWTGKSSASIAEAGREDFDAVYSDMDRLVEDLFIKPIQEVL
jgi:hypothetical protein